MTHIPIDKPTTQDRLGFEPFRRALNEIIQDAVETPFAIGIFGTWGSGKTSLMKMIEANLSKEKHRIAWFDAWKFTQQDALWRALLLRVLQTLKPFEASESDQEKDPNEIKREQSAREEIEKLEQALYGDLTWTETGKVVFDWREGFKGLGGSILSLVLATQPGFLTEIAKAAQANVGKTQTLSDAFGFLKAFSRETVEHHQAQLRSLEQFQDSFKRVLELTLAPGQTFVLFVDDLDRCLPEKAIEVLEAIKLFLDVERCIFVLGVDPAVVEHAILVRYRAFTKAGVAPLSGRNYLEKIIQVPFHLPPIDESDVEDYICQQMAQEVTGESVGNSAKIFAAGLEANPRTVKRALSTFRVLLALAGHREGVAASRNRPIPATQIQPGLLAKIVVIQDSFRDLYDECVRWPVLIQDLEADVLRYGVLLPGTDSSAGPDFSSTPQSTLVERFRNRPTLRRMLAIEPLFRDLSPQAIRDHIYLTRSDRGLASAGGPLESDVWSELISGDPTRIQSILDRVRSHQDRYLVKLNQSVVNISADATSRTNAALALRWVAPGSGNLRAVQNDLVSLLVLSSTPVRLRLTAAQTLAYIGDPRDLDEMIEIPEGEFTYGQDNRSKHVGAFRVGKYPVTNAQYKEFIDANQECRVPFVDEDWARPYNWDREERTYPAGRANHPVVLVSWDDAKAYCRWLSTLGEISARLPTEIEWEKAARGAQGQDYPWPGPFSPDKANTSESGIRETTPVGIYPDGASPYGLLDCAGNVLEWTADEHEGGGIVLRGGSWSDNQFEARCATRTKSFPAQMENFVGFRIACSAG